MKATKQYFPVVLFITFHKVVLTFKYVDEIPECDHSSERSRAVHVLFSHVVRVSQIATDNFHLAKEVHSTVA